MGGDPSRYPPIADYALLSDCHAAALVSRSGSIDWCCLPRFDEGSTFGRLLDWERGGCCAIMPETGAGGGFQRYLDGTLVLETIFRTQGGEARVLDCFLMPPAGDRGTARRLLRVIEGVRGSVPLRLRVAPRFDYGEIEPWLRHHGKGVFSATGGDDGLVIWSNARLEMDDGSPDLVAETVARAGERAHLLVTYLHPEKLDEARFAVPDSGALDSQLEETVAWWRDWVGNLRVDDEDSSAVIRSALVLKALAYEPTGAMIAAPTTSLPEAGPGGRTWDYRYSWIRDSALASRSLADLGCEREAGAFRRFVERAAAGHARDLRIAYGVGGERRIDEVEIEHLEGYRGCGPVRLGNAAATQTQLDACGQLVVQSWRWHRRGHDPDDDYWRFLLTLVDSAIERWPLPDAGIWEWRGEPRHFVHSKVLCWAAVECGLRLASECMRKAPERRWREARDEIRETIEERGYDEQRGVFVQAFGDVEADAALLLLPAYDFVDWHDERMVRTTDFVMDELSDSGLVRRYTLDDSLPGADGAFLPCSFWLAEALARQGRDDLARRTFDRAMTTATELGLFAEEVDPESGELRGNFPQALTHLSHIEAAFALSDRRSAPADPGKSPH